MKHGYRGTGLLLLAMGVALPALAQMRVAGPPTETRQVTLPPPPQGTAREREQAEERREEPQRVRRLEDKPAAAPAKPPVAARPVVYDSQGRRVHGVRQAGPNRVLDERTGRYHATVPSGDGQRIVGKDGGAP